MQHLYTEHPFKYDGYFYPAHFMYNYRVEEANRMMATPEWVIYTPEAIVCKAGCVTWPALFCAFEKTKRYEAYTV